MTTREKADALCKLWPTLPAGVIAYLESLDDVTDFEARDVKKVDELCAKYGKTPEWENS